MSSRKLDNAISEVWLHLIKQFLSKFLPLPQRLATEGKPSSFLFEAGITEFKSVHQVTTRGFFTQGCQPQCSIKLYNRN